MNTGQDRRELGPGIFEGVEGQVGVSSFSVSLSLALVEI